MVSHREMGTTHTHKSAPYSRSLSTSSPPRFPPPPLRQSDVDCSLESGRGFFVRRRRRRRRAERGLLCISHTLGGGGSSQPQGGHRLEQHAGGGRREPPRTERVLCDSAQRDGRLGGSLALHVPGPHRTSLASKRPKQWKKIPIFSPLTKAKALANKAPSYQRLLGPTLGSLRATKEVLGYHVGHSAPPCCGLVVRPPYSRCARGRQGTFKEVYYKKGWRQGSRLTGAEKNVRRSLLLI